MTAADRSPLPTAARAAISFAAWPIVAAALLFRIVVGNGSATTSEHHKNVGAKLNRLLIDFESIAHVQSGAGSVFAFRDAFLRYTGLATTFSEADSSVAIAEIFEISEHPAPTIASICLSRRTRSRLLLHLNHARREFADFAAELSAGSEEPAHIGKLAIAIAEAVSDGEGMSQLRSIFDPPAAALKRNLSADGGEQIWNTEQTNPVAN